MSDGDQTNDDESVASAIEAELHQLYDDILDFSDYVVVEPLDLIDSFFEGCKKSRQWAAWLSLVALALGLFMDLWNSGGTMFARSGYVVVVIGIVNAGTWRSYYHKIKLQFESLRRTLEDLQSRIRAMKRPITEKQAAGESIRHALDRLSIRSDIFLEREIMQFWRYEVGILAVGTLASGFGDLLV